MIGTGAISHMHARAYQNIGYQLTVCTDIYEPAGAQVRGAARRGVRPHAMKKCAATPTWTTWTCARSRISACSPCEICAEAGKHIQVQKPISTSLETARRMVETARRAGILLGVVSQHRFDDSSLFLSPGDRRRPPGQAAPVRLLREVVPFAGILCAAHQGELADRRRRRADQPGDSPDRHSALAGRPGERGVRPAGSWARCTRSNPRTW